MRLVTDTDVIRTSCILFRNHRTDRFTVCLTKEELRRTIKSGRGHFPSPKRSIFFISLEGLC